MGPVGKAVQFCWEPSIVLLLAVHGTGNKMEGESTTTVYTVTPREDKIK